ncbi:hypothetical protein protein [Bacillus cereus G9241]|nr:hypothetical protein protein [Bacillus cereus G9241]
MKRRSVSLFFCFRNTFTAFFLAIVFTTFLKELTYSFLLVQVTKRL